ncbi:MAG TPA: hypothetical protein ACYCC3_01335 [Candidatus Azoamicus sp.]
MYKNVLLVGIDEFICDNFFKFVDKKILCLSDNLVYLEKLKKKFYINIYPLTYTESDILTFKSIISIKSYVINEIIFNVNYFLESKPIKSINFDKFSLFFDLNFKFFFVLLKNLLPTSNNPKDIFITFLINKRNIDKSNFLYQQECINTLLISFMKELNKEFETQNMYVNCISLENVNLFYRKSIYPYRRYNFSDENFYNVYKFLIKKKIRNKIIVS